MTITLADFARAQSTLRATCRYWPSNDVKMTLKSKLRDACARLWNPIGVPMANVSSREELGYPPMPEDEYDAYLYGLVSRIRSGASFDELLGYLNEVERDHLMLSHPAGDKRAFIDAALSIVTSR